MWGFVLLMLFFVGVAIFKAFLAEYVRLRNNENTIRRARRDDDRS